MSKKQQKVCATLNYIKHLLILASTITGCISISVFASLIGILTGITSSPIELKSVSNNFRKKKKKKKHDKIVSLVKFNVSHDEFV